MTRDFAFLVPADLPAGELVRAVRGADKALIAAARLFDRYEGEQGLSLAVEVTLQPGEKSFTDAELEAIAGEDRRGGGEARALDAARASSSALIAAWTPRLDLARA